MIITNEPQKATGNFNLPHHPFQKNSRPSHSVLISDIFLDREAVVMASNKFHKAHY
jgi:hypothetical protein